MKCQFCGKPASVHLTEVVEHKKAELHLCEACSEKHQLWIAPNQELNVPALLSLLLDKGDSAGLLCPECGLEYDQFRARGRLGCPHDYLAFESRLTELIEKIHQNRQHRGKVPGQGSDPMSPDRLRERMDRAVAAEEYEEAARLRDLIRLRRGEVSEGSDG